MSSIFGGNTSSTLGLNLNLVPFIPQKDSFYPRLKVFRVKRSKFNSIPRVDHFLQLTIYLKTDHHLPQMTRDLLKKKKRKIEGEKVIWCEEIWKYGAVFIGGNGSIGYNNHKCGQKNV